MDNQIQICKQKIKKEIVIELIIELIIESLYNCLKVERGIVSFDKYSINEKHMMFLLKNYDIERLRVEGRILRAEDERQGEE